jgi:hypothetical protein
MKKIYTAIFFILMIQSLAHAAPERGPSVEPLMEVDIEKANVDTISGYNFAGHEKRAPAAEKKRVPANITAKTNATTPYSFIGPFIFLITLPIALWIMVSKRFKSPKSERQVDYYGKTHQFTPKHTSNESVDDDDIDYPKAS